MLHCGSNCSLVWATDGCIMHRSIISSCQSAATSEIVKALLGMCHPVSSAISSTGPSVFYTAIEFLQVMSQVV